MNGNIPLIEPRQRFNVVVEAITDDARETITFTDAGFQVAGSGTLSVTTQDGKQVSAWANGYWASVNAVASDG